MLVDAPCDVRAEGCEIERAAVCVWVLSKGLVVRHCGTMDTGGTVGIIVAVAVVVALAFSYVM